MKIIEKNKKLSGSIIGGVPNPGKQVANTDRLTSERSEGDGDNWLGRQNSGYEDVDHPTDQAEQVVKDTSTQSEEETPAEAQATAARSLQEEKTEQQTTREEKLARLNPEQIKTLEGLEREVGASVDPETVFPDVFTDETPNTPNELGAEYEPGSQDQVEETESSKSVPEEPAKVVKDTQAPDPKGVDPITGDKQEDSPVGLFVDTYGNSTDVSSIRSENDKRRASALVRGSYGKPLQQTVKREQSQDKGSLQKGFTGKSIYTTLIGNPSIAPNEVGIHVDNIRMLLSHSPEIVKVIHDADPNVDISSEEEVYSFFSTHDVYVAFTKSPSNLGASYQKKILRPTHLFGLQLHPAFTKASNADFDGDQGTVSFDAAGIAGASFASRFLINIDNEAGSDVEFFYSPYFEADRKSDSPKILGKVADAIRQAVIDSSVNDESQIIFGDPSKLYQALITYGRKKDEASFNEMLRAIGTYCQDIAGNILEEDRMLSNIFKAIYDVGHDLTIVEVMSRDDVMLLDSFPESTTIYDDALNKLADEQYLNLVEGNEVFNFSAFKKLFLGHIGEPDNVAASFRFTGRVAKAYNLSERVYIGTKEDDMREIWNQMSWFVMSRRMAREANKEEYNEAVSHTIRAKVLEKVKVPGMGSEGFTKWLVDFARVFNNEIEVYESVNVNSYMDGSDTRGSKLPGGYSRITFDKNGMPNIGEAEKAFNLIYTDLTNETLFVNKNCHLTLADIKSEATYNVGLFTDTISGHTQGEEYRGEKRNRKLLVMSRQNAAMSYGRFCNNNTIRVSKDTSKWKKDYLKSTNGVSKAEDIEEIDLQNLKKFISIGADHKTYKASQYNNAFVELTVGKKKTISGHAIDAIGNLIDIEKEIRTEIAKGNYDQADYLQKVKLRESVDLYSIIQFSSQEIFDYFEIDNLTDFLKSQYWAKIKQCYNENIKKGKKKVLDKVNGIRVVALINIRMDPIRKIAEKALSSRHIGEFDSSIITRMNEEILKLSSSSKYWNGILAELMDHGVWDGTKEFTGDHNVLNAKLFWNNKNGQEPNKQDYKSFADFLFDPNVAYSLKAKVCSDVVRQQLDLVELQSAEFGYQMELGPNNEFFDEESGKRTPSHLAEGQNSVVNSYHRHCYDKLKEEVREAKDKYQGTGVLTKLIKMLANNPQMVVKIPDYMYVDGMVSCVSKVSGQASKNKQHEAMDALFQSKTYQVFGRSMNDIERCGDYVLGLRADESLTWQDLIKVLSDPDYSIEAYDAAGRRYKDGINQKTLGIPNNATEDDLWNFFMKYPALATCLQFRQPQRVPNVVSSGNVYLASTGTLTRSLEEAEAADDRIIAREKLKSMLTDHPTFLAMVTLGTRSERHYNDHYTKIYDEDNYGDQENNDYKHPTEYYNSSYLRPKYEKNLDRLLDNIIYLANHPELDVIEMINHMFVHDNQKIYVHEHEKYKYDTISDLIIGEYFDSITEETAIQLENEVVDAIRRYINEIKEDPSFDSVEVPDRFEYLGMDVTSIATYFDAKESFISARTQFQTSIEGGQTKKFHSSVALLLTPDLYADGISLEESEINALFDGQDSLEVTNAQGETTLMTSDELAEAINTIGDDDELIITVADRSKYLVPDKTLSASDHQATSLGTYFMVRRENGAETFNLKVKKKGDDGTDSITKKKENDLRKNASCEAEIFLTIDKQIKEVFASALTTMNVDEAKRVACIALAKILKQGSEDVGYTDFNLADFMNLADLMIGVDDTVESTTVVIRSLEQIIAAVHLLLPLESLMQEKATVNDIKNEAMKIAKGTGFDTSDLSALDAFRDIESVPPLQANIIETEKYKALKTAPKLADPLAMEEGEPQSQEQIEFQNKLVLTLRFTGYSDIEIQVLWKYHHTLFTESDDLSEEDIADAMIDAIKQANDEMPDLNLDTKRSRHVLDWDIAYEYAQDCMDICEDNEIEIISIASPDYPNRCKINANTPVCLFVQGNKEILKYPKTLSLIHENSVDKQIDWTKKRETISFMDNDIETELTEVMGEQCVLIDSVGNMSNPIYETSTRPMIWLDRNSLDNVMYSDDANSIMRIRQKAIRHNGVIVSAAPPGVEAARGRRLKDLCRLQAGLSDGAIVLHGEESGLGKKDSGPKSEGSTRSRSIRRKQNATKHIQRRVGHNGKHKKNKTSKAISRVNSAKNGVGSWSDQKGSRSRKKSTFKGTIPTRRRYVDPIHYSSTFAEEMEVREKPLFVINPATTDTNEILDNSYSLNRNLLKRGVRSLSVFEEGDGVYRFYDPELDGESIPQEVTLSDIIDLMDDYCKGEYKNSLFIREEERFDKVLTTMPTINSFPTAAEEMVRLRKAYSKTHEDESDILRSPSQLEEADKETRRKYDIYARGETASRSRILNSKFLENYSFLGAVGRSPKKAFGPRILWVLDGAETSIDKTQSARNVRNEYSRIYTDLKLAKSLGVTVLITPEGRDKYWDVLEASRLTFDMIPCPGMPDGFFMLKMFDMRLNGSNASPTPPKFSIYRLPNALNNITSLVQDSSGEWELGDAQVKIYKSFVDNINVSWGGDCSLTKEELFGPTLEKVGDRTTVMRMATDEEIRRFFIDKNDHPTIDYGIAEYEKLYPEYKNYIDSLLDKYSGDIKMFDGSVAPGSAILDFAALDIYDIMGENKVERRVVFAPIIPFANTPNSHKLNVPSGFQILPQDGKYVRQGIQVDDAFVDDESHISFTWKWNDSLNGHYVKAYEYNNGQDKMVGQVEEHPADGGRLMNGMPVGMAVNENSTITRRPGESARLSTMESMMFASRLEIWNLADNDDTFPNSEAFDEKYALGEEYEDDPDYIDVTDLKKKLLVGQFTRRMWGSLIHDEEAWADLHILPDLATDSWLKEECWKWYLNGGNPSDLLCTAYIDPNTMEWVRTGVYWEFSRMFSVSRTYEDQLLKFLHKAISDRPYSEKNVKDRTELNIFGERVPWREFCPNGLNAGIMLNADWATNGKRYPLFKINKNTGTLQMQVPHQHQGQAFATWEDVFIGLHYLGDIGTSFFNQERSYGGAPMTFENIDARALSAASMLESGSSNMKTVSTEASQRYDKKTAPGYTPQDNETAIRKELPPTISDQDATNIIYRYLRYNSHDLPWTCLVDEDVDLLIYDKTIDLFDTFFGDANAINKIGAIFGHGTDQKKVRDWLYHNGMVGTKIPGLGEFPNEHILYDNDQVALNAYKGMIAGKNKDHNSPSPIDSLSDEALLRLNAEDSFENYRINELRSILKRLESIIKDPGRSSAEINSAEVLAKIIDTDIKNREKEEKLDAPENESSTASTIPNIDADTIGRDPNKPNSKIGDAFSASPKYDPNQPNVSIGDVFKRG